MAILTQTLLGVFIGILALHARFDSLWYPHFGSDISTLKSKVTSLERSLGATFYKSMLNTPPQYLYALGVVAAFILLGQVGAVIQKSSQRVLNVLSLLLFLTASTIHVLAYRPLLKTFSPKYVRPDDEAKGLYSIAIWNAITLGLLVASAFITMGTEEEWDETPKKKKE